MNRTFPIKRIEVSVYTIPTDAPEADGTFSWSSTTMVLVEISAGNEKGIGYSYCDDSAAGLIQQSFVSLLKGRDALAISELWTSMLWRERKVGRAGIASSAISAVDIALWDLKAKLLGVSLVALLSKCRD